MNTLLFALLTVFLLGIAINPVFADSLSEKYYTQPFWIYQIEIEYTGDEPFSIFWNGKQVSSPLPDEGLTSLEIEVYATTNETTLQIFDADDPSDLSADIRSFDVVEIRRMSTDEIRHAKSLGVEDPRDIRIAELEDRVSALENKNSELLKINQQLQDQINHLKTPDTANADSELVCIDKIWMESNNGKITCVSPNTAEKLVERGWGTILHDDT